MNLLFHVYYYTLFLVICNTSDPTSLYRFCSLCKLVHKIDRQNEWFSALWRHYDVITLVEKICSMFYYTLEMIIFKTSGHSTLYHFPFSRKLVHKMCYLCTNCVICDVIITWLMDSKLFIMYFTKYGIDVSYICIPKEVWINCTSGRC